MKTIRRADVTIFDMGMTLVIVPVSIQPPFEDWGGIHYTGQAAACGGFERFSTKAGREAIRVTPGTSYALTLRDGSGDRSWGDWSDRAPARSEHGDVFAYAVATSNGGGCWFEVTLVPTAGYETWYEASIADELAEMEVTR